MDSGVKDRVVGSPVLSALVPTHLGGWIGSFWVVWDHSEGEARDSCSTGNGHTLAFRVDVV